jgi:hypothetical protein
VAVDQERVAEIIMAASADDPAVRLQNLEREVDLLKITIKRILMDIRERMNELENPFTIGASGVSLSGAGSSGQEMDVKESALDAREAALDARESGLKLSNDSAETKKPQEMEPDKTGPDPLLSLLEDPVPDRISRVPGSWPVFAASPVPAHPPAPEMLPLQKAYNLFRWTQSGAKKFGNDPLITLAETYCVMGYIQKRTLDEIRELSRLMPISLGRDQPIGPDEFVFEIYTLNRILSPGDTSLDRDMIEVMMESRRQGERSAAGDMGTGSGIIGIVREKKKAGSPGFLDNDLEGMNLRA